MRYSEAAAAVSEVASVSAPTGSSGLHGLCSANGCPLPGGIRESGSWVCGYHRGKLPVEWPRITADIIADQQAGRLDQRGNRTDRQVSTAVAAMRKRVRATRQPGEEG